MKPIAQYVSFTGNIGCYGELPLGVLAGATTFTIEAKLSTMSTKKNSNNFQWATIIGRELSGGWQDDFGLCVNDGKLCFWSEPKTGGSSSTSNTTSDAFVNDGAIHKVAVVSSNGAIDLYCDGSLVAHQNNVNAKISATEVMYLATSYTTESEPYPFLQMDLYEVRCWSIARTQEQIFADLQGDEQGLEAWYIPSGDSVLKDGSINGRDATLYGSPNYIYIDTLPITFILDIVRTLKFRYENAGTADSLITSGTTLTVLPESKSKTGTAFYQTSHAKCFDLPATPEIWIKFDVYFNGSTRWRAYNGGANGPSGICSQTNSELNYWANGSNVYTLSNGAAKNQLQTVLLHMLSDSSAGVIEAWVDGNFIYRYTGDVNHGQDFADIYLQSDGAGTFFSNVIISNTEIDLDEGYQIFLFDAERRITKQVDIAFDVERRVKNVTNVLFNADVLIQDVLPATLAADTERRVQRPFELDLDVEILDVFPVEVLLDVTRNILAKIKLMDTDTSQYFSSDTSEPVVIPSQVIPFAPDDSSTLQSLEISLSEQQLTDQVNFVTTAPFEIMQQFGGQYLDYQNQMRVETIRQDGILFSCSCCSDIDELLYTQFNYQLDSGFVAFVPDYSTMTLSILPPYEETSETILRKGKASSHLQKIAALLGVSEVICNFDDFVSTMNERQSDVTYQDLISQLFGWTSRLPQRMINTFLRNGKLYAIQRGREEHVLDLSQADCSYPIYERRLIRTMWGSGKFGIDPITEQEHVNNKKLMGGIRVYPWPPEWSSDYKTHYTYKNVSGYGGIEHGYALTSTETYNDDGGRTIVYYNYDFIRGIYTCTSEQSRTYDADGNKVDERKTIHDRLTPSQQFSRMDDEDGNTVASNVGSNLPGFYDEWFWAKLPIEVGWEYDVDKITGYNPLIDTDFPVLDIYSQLIEAYAWLNRRTQETISFDVYDYPHLIDFNDRVLFGGNEYYLVSNTATSNERIRNKQSLRLVRWY